MAQRIWYQINGKLRLGGQPPDEVIARIPYAGEQTQQAAKEHARKTMRTNKMNSSSTEVVAIVDGEGKIMARVTAWDVV